MSRASDAETIQIWLWNRRPRFFLSAIADRAEKRFPQPRGSASRSLGKNDEIE
jgi:hypothetical protein